MSWDVAVRLLEPAEWPMWECFVAGAPSGSVYSLPSYLDILCSAAGGRFRVLAATRGDEIVGGVALYERSSTGGAFVSPRLLLYYNGIVIRNYETSYPSENTSRHLKILTALEEGLRALRFGSINLRSRCLMDIRPFVARGWVAEPSYSYEVALDMPAAWARVEQNLRRLVERARREDLQFHDDDDFESFFELHLTTLDRHGTGVYLPKDAFRSFCSALRRQSLGRLFHVRTAAGRTVASQLVLLGPHPVSHTVSAGALPEFNKLGASAFLRWSGFDALAALGFRSNDLTDAQLNPVTHFKSQFGGSLATTMVLHSPSSRRFRWSADAARAAERARAGAAAIARRLMHAETAPE